MFVGTLLCLSLSSFAQGTKRAPAAAKNPRTPAQATPAPAAPAASATSSATATATSSAASTSAESSELDALLAAPEPEPEVEAKPAASPSTAKEANSEKTAKASANSAAVAARASRVMLLDPWRQGWKSRDFSHSLGFAAGLLGSGNTLVIENNPDAESSWGFHFGFNKLADTFAEANNTAVTGSPATSTTNTMTRTGLKRNATFSFGTTYMMRAYKNDFILVRWGGFGGIDYISDAKYGVGSRTSVESSGTPGTISVTEAGLGETSVKSSPGIKLGPVFDASLYLRWFPNISVGFLGGMLYDMDRKLTSRTSTVSRSYQIVNGVEQAPTSYTSTNSETVSSQGPVLSTFALGGQNFNLFGSFVIRYLW